MPASRRKDPVHLYCTLAMSNGRICVAWGGAYDPRFGGWGEAPVKYHPDSSVALTYDPRRVGGHGQTGSLTGAVASQNVTEAPKARLRRIGNPLRSARAKAGLTVRHTGRAGESWV